MMFANPHTPPTQTSQSGFALLFTIIIVSVVLAIGLTILDFTIKQIVLSSVTRDSEVAYHAANAGAECLRAVRQADPFASEFADNGSPTVSCFDKAVSDSGSKSVSASDVHAFSFAFTWGGGNVPERCTEVDVVVAHSNEAGEDITGIGDEAAYGDFAFPVDPQTGNRLTYECPESTGVCNFVFARGSNRACSATVGTGKIEREIFERF